MKREGKVKRTYHWDSNLSPKIQSAMLTVAIQLLSAPSIIISRKFATECRVGFFFYRVDSLRDRYHNEPETDSRILLNFTQCEFWPLGSKRGHRSHCSFLIEHWKNTESVNSHSAIPELFASRMGLWFHWPRLQAQLLPAWVVAVLDNAKYWDAL